MAAILFDADPDWTDPFTTTWSYRTGIIRGHKNLEERRMKRDIPRRTDTFNVAAESPRDTTRIEALLAGAAQDQQWIVPFWPGSVPLTASATAGQTVLPVTTTANRGFLVGNYAVISGPNQRAEAKLISATSATSITVAAISSAWPTAYVTPGNTGYLDQDVRDTRSGPRMRDRNLVAFVLDPFDPALAVASDTASVFFSTAFSREALNSTGVRDIIRFDSPTYTFKDTAHSVMPAREFSIDAICETHDEVAAIVNAWHALRGAYKVFYFPSFQDDLPVVGTIGAADTTVTISSCDYTLRLFPHRARRHLAFVQPNGTVATAVVTAATDNGTTEVLTLAAAFGVAKPVDFGILGFLLYGRMGSDVLEVAYDNPSGLATISFPFLELVDEIEALGL